MIYDCSELEGRVLEQQTLNPVRSVLAVENVQDLSDPIRHQQSIASDDKQKEDEDEASFSDSS